MRLFTAILPDPGFRGVLEDLSKAFAVNALKGNFTRPENIHLTLVFIGETERVGDIKRALDCLSAAPFDMALAGAGYFKRGDGLICWAGLEETPALTELHAQTRFALAKAAIVTENRAFKPHITLGRRVVFRPGFNAAECPVRKVSMKAVKLSLMKSEQIAGKLTYTEIYSKKFARPEIRSPLRPT